MPFKKSTTHNNLRNSLRLPQATAEVDNGDSALQPRETTNMKTQTVASYFRFSLMDLLSKMVGGLPHFVRCIKPNNDRHAKKFDQEKVLVQLRYTGILETARIRRQGYSHRVLFANFIERYYILAFKSTEEPPVNPDTCAAILEKSKLENWVLGKTKVFLKYYHVEQLNLMKKEIIDRIVLVQAYVKAWLGARRYRRIQEKRQRSAVAIQSAYRGHKVRKNIASEKQKLEQEITKIQAAARGYLCRKEYKEMMEEKRNAAVKIQAHYRGYVDRRNINNKIGYDTNISDQERNIIESDRIKNNQASNKSIKDKLGENMGRTPLGNATTMSDVKGEEGGSPKVIHGNQEKQREEDDTKAAIVIKSNYRGHQERKRQQENKVPVKTKEIKVSNKGIQKPHFVANGDPNEEPGASGIQSKTREHKSLKEKGKLGGHGDLTIKDKSTTISSKEDEEHTAVKIQSNYRGFKEKKQIEENTKREGEMFATFSKQITKRSEEFLMAQKKLNEVLGSQYLTFKNQNPPLEKKLPEKNPPNQNSSPGPNKGSDQKQQRTPRRTQPPKTLNTPEDSTYYNLVHRSVQDGKRRPRKDSQVKLLDADDRYYKQITPSDSLSKENHVEATGRMPPAQARSTTPNHSNSSSAPKEGCQDEDNPYDYRKLLRKTSQRNRLIEQC
ncbi:myosin-IIIa [Stegostoma tigrinum]|uniref:myosin-IIIa n=1 Tax=Stegostoma tigrinum TaxID=3053191 RepID=UPI0028706E45|nr:myosin-IIIa [Stegostoma tigrinum]